MKTAFKRLTIRRVDDLSDDTIKLVPRRLDTTDMVPRRDDFISMVPESRGEMDMSEITRAVPTGAADAPMPRFGRRSSID